MQGFNLPTIRPVANCDNKIVARAAVAPATALPALTVAALYSAWLFMASAMPLLVPRSKLVEVLNLTAWAVVLPGLLLTGGLWTVAHTPRGPRIPAPWTNRLMALLTVHWLAVTLFALAVALSVGYGLFSGEVVMVTGLVMSLTALAALAGAWPSAKRVPSHAPALLAAALAMVLHGVFLARFGPQWRVSSLSVMGWQVTPVVVSHLLLIGGVLVLLDPVSVKKWNGWAVGAAGFVMATLFLLNSSLGPEAKNSTGWLRGLHPLGGFIGLLIMHRFFPAHEKRKEQQPPAYQKPMRFLRWGAFVFLALSVVLAFKTMSGDWQQYPLMRQAHFHANTLGFASAWIFAHMADELEALLGSDHTVYLVLDSQKNFLWAAAVLTLLGALGLTGAFLLPGKPHAVSGIGGLCTMAASLLWLRLFLMGRVMVKRQCLKSS